MFCIISFVILSILGIFSASNRELARESLDCVLRRVTFRPCTTGFDEKMKAKILGVVITRSEKGARFLNKNFEILSWVFFVLLLGSSLWSVRGLYLFYTTGSCSGANSAEFCVFDPTGANNQVSTASQVCTEHPTPQQMILNLKIVDLSQFPTFNKKTEENVVMIACYHCDFSRETYPLIRELSQRFNVGLTFIHYPVKEPTDHFTKLSYCVNKLSPEKYWAYNDQMFVGDKTNLDSEAYISQLLKNAGIDPAPITTCVDDPATETIVKEQMKEVAGTGFTGTPTVFMKEQVFIGPKPYRVYAITLRGLFYWLIPSNRVAG
jgi:protein-disulfide isomerase